MSTDNAQKLSDLLVASLAPDGNATATALVAASQVNTIKYKAYLPLDASINTTANVILDMATPIKYKVSAFKVALNAALTETNTNLAQIQLVYNNANGGSDTNIALVYTNVAGGIGNVTAAIPASITLTAANQVIPAGSQVAIRETKAGAGGLVLPMRFYEVTLIPSV